MSHESARRASSFDAQAGLVALRRASLRAERLALMTGTSLVIVIDGKPVLVPPRADEVIRAQEAALSGT